jgi:hypothetical protein
MYHWDWEGEKAEGDDSLRGAKGRQGGFFWGSEELLEVGRYGLPEFDPAGDECRRSRDRGGTIGKVGLEAAAATVKLGYKKGGKI